MKHLSRLRQPQSCRLLEAESCVGAFPVLAAAGDKELGRSDLVWLFVYSHAWIC